MPVEVKERLWRHYERMGRFADAENWLFELLDDPQAPPDTAARGVDFYGRLLARNDEELLIGNLPRSEILASLAELQSR